MDTARTRAVDRFAGPLVPLDVGRQQQLGTVAVTKMEVSILHHLRLFSCLVLPHYPQSRILRPPRASHNEGVKLRPQPQRIPDGEQGRG